MRGSTTRRRALGTVAATVLLLVAAATGDPAAGQEQDPGTSTTTGPTSSTTAPPGGGASDGSTTSTTSPPSTVVLEDGDVGVLPPGADDPDGDPSADPSDPGDGNTDGDGPTVDPNDPLAGDDSDAEIPEEIPVVILPDPTPGLNAALAEIDVGRARDALDEAEPARVDADVAVAEAHARLKVLRAARREAGDDTLAAQRRIQALAVNAVIFGDLSGRAPIFEAEDLDDLRARALGEAAAEELHAAFDEQRSTYAVTIDAEVAATSALVAAERRQRAAEATYLEVRTELHRAVKHAEEARRLVGPSILGPTVLGVDDLVAWYFTYYSADPPVAPIETIIESYVRIGTEEGIAGDIAFAQAILETGGFRSGHARNLNFAGIGAYDSCSPVCGFAFPSMDAGVRAHLHLLRAYADPALTSDQLTSTPDPRVAPERVAVKGCCQRWTQLTGVWATDINYDRKVLGIYRLMVEIGRARGSANL